MKYEEILDRIKQELEKQGVSITTLAGALGVTYCNMWQFVNNKRTMNVALIVSIADYLGVDAGWLITGKERGEEDTATRMETDRMFDKIIQWGDDRDISNPINQMVKVSEEVGEIAHELSRGRMSGAALKDALGDTIVATTILAHILGYDIRECIDAAYSEIRNRKGKTINGGFVKEQ